MAAWRPRRRCDGLGRARTRSARLRVDRRRLTGNRPVRSTSRPCPLRGVRQLTPSGGGADVGETSTEGLRSWSERDLRRTGVSSLLLEVRSMISALNGLPDGVIGFEASGKIAAEDYRDVVVPHSSKPPR